MTRDLAERGSVTVELALITPVLLTLLLLTVSLGRMAAARSDVDAAARDAARAASLARSTNQAIDDGTDAARRTLTEGGVTCRKLMVAIDADSFRAGGSVRATVSCDAELETLSGIGLPGSRTISSTFVEPVDLYRGTR